MEKKSDHTDISTLHKKNHDLKNHLMSMRGYLHILGKKIQNDPQILSFITIIDSKIEKVGELSTEMVNIIEKKEQTS